MKRRCRSCGRKYQRPWPAAVQRDGKEHEFASGEQGQAQIKEQCHGIAEAAEYMAQFGVDHIERYRKYGVEAEGLSGDNYISAASGDGQAYSMFVTLDGVMEAPGGEPSHAHSGWVFDYLGQEQERRDWVEAQALAFQASISRRPEIVASPKDSL
jgi:hypothetical protein